MIGTLTPRELQVVQLVARGLADKEIALQLSISPLTARNHLRAAREKTGLSNRTQLAMYAVRCGIAERTW
jgi:DNA-binding CsgD family transcriptional regulator